MGKDRPGWEETSRRKKRAGKRELSRLEGRTFQGTKGKGCVKWSKKWAAGEKREAGDGARRKGAGGGSRAGQEARGPRLAWAARRQQPKSEQRGRFQPRQAPALGGGGA